MIEVKEVSTKEELVTVFKIREKVFVIEQKVNPEEEYDEFETISVHYLATFLGTPCGTARWRETTNGIKLERFAVLEEYRNKNAGSAILTRVLRDVKERAPGKTVYLHAQLPAIRFYERHGFSKLGAMFSECNIDHYKMILSS